MLCTRCSLQSLVCLSRLLCLRCKFKSTARSSLYEFLDNKMLQFADWETRFDHDYVSLHPLLLLVVSKEHFTMANILEMR